MENHEPYCSIASLPAERKIRESLKSHMRRRRSWDFAKSSAQGAVLPCFCVALLRAIQVCVPDHEDYFFENCSDDVIERMAQSIERSMEEDLYYARRHDIKFHGFERTEDYMDEEWMFEQFGRDDQLRDVSPALRLEDHCMHFVREVAEEGVGVRFTVLEADAPSPCIKTAAASGLADLSKWVVALRLSLPGLFGVEVFTKQGEANQLELYMVHINASR